MNGLRPRLGRVLGPLVGLLLLAGYAPGARAQVDLTLDAETISELLAALTPEKLRLPLAGGHSVLLHISDLKVTGFDPAGGSNQKGYVLTSLRLQAPELGLSFPVEPRVSLNVLEGDDGKVCELRFHEVKINIPMVGAANVSPLLPRILIPAEHVGLTRGARGDVQVRSRLVDVLMGTRALRLRFDVSVEAIEGQEL